MQIPLKQGLKQGCTGRGPIESKLLMQIPLKQGLKPACPAVRIAGYNFC